MLYFWKEIVVLVLMELVFFFRVVLLLYILNLFKLGELKFLVLLVKIVLGIFIKDRMFFKFWMLLM